MPEAIDLHLRICMTLGKWDLGDNLASVLRIASDEEEEQDEDYRSRYAITCAEFYHARARALVADGDIAGAKERVNLASEQWPPIRLEMLDDPATRVRAKKPSLDPLAYRESQSETATRCGYGLVISTL
jgi:hypothetical protein